MTYLWNNLSVSTQVMDLADFKVQIKKDFKPVKYKHFAKGSKIGNTLLTRIRLERSDLKLHKGGLSGVEADPELVAKHIGNCGWN